MSYLKKFVNRLKLAQARQAKEFTIPMQEANGLHLEITEMLEAVYVQKSMSKPAENINETSPAVLAGGEFKN